MLVHRGPAEERLGVENCGFLKSLLCVNIMRVWVRIRVTEHRFTYALLRIIEELKTFVTISNCVLWNIKKIVL